MSILFFLVIAINRLLNYIINRRKTFLNNPRRINSPFEQKPMTVHFPLEPLVCSTKNWKIIIPSLYRAELWKGASKKINSYPVHDYAPKL